MKIAVFFGSFNPLTNAHVAALKTTVEHLGADRGLFVATNGQYLRRKMVKLGDPFYLTEAERREVIEQVCASEEKLAFWGFEQGGINPKRYRTLCAIGRQYPDAEFYEVQGADKVHTIAKCADAEAYLSHIQFAVFARDDIDLHRLIDTTPRLSNHRDAFFLLPPLAESDVSSTEVRRRFYAGEDYSALLPSASVTLLKRHQPDDFGISYEERMKTVMRSGRFGVNRACRLVYEENTALFREWQDGTSAMGWGSSRDFLDNTTLFREAFTVDNEGALFPETVTGCVNADCVDVAQALLDDGYNPAILNLASAHHPGGGYDKGLQAQEESLCRSSTLSLSLYQFADPARMKCVRESGVSRRQPGYPLDENYGGIYTPNVTFFRHGKSRFFTLREAPFGCDVITTAALNFNERSNYARASDLRYRASGGGFMPDGEAVMLNKIRTIFRMGVRYGKDALVLGAFGCGAYRLPSAEVARLFRQVMEEPEFAGKFRLLVFAILESTRRPHGLDGKFAPFYREFGTYEK